MLTDVKRSLRISVNQFDTEIADLIAAARIELIQAGVRKDKAESDTDSLIKRAVTVYCKANFGYDNPEADRMALSFWNLKQSLRLSADYSGYLVEFEVTDGTNPLENALISFNGYEAYTDDLGQASFNGVSPSQNMDYSIQLDGYKTINDEVDVSTDKVVTVTMEGV